MNFSMKNLRYDLPSSIVVFLVALPLCLGIALASGAPLFSGLIAGIVGGIVIGALSNSPLSVSGPAAGLTAVILSSISKLGAFDIFLVAVVLAGVIQIILGILKAGTFANYIPSSVIKGMLTAIGIIIIMKQIPHAFGYDKEAEGDFEFISNDGDNTFSRLLHPLEHIDLGASIIAIAALLIIILWNKPFMNKFKSIPSGLIAVLTGIVLNELFKMSFPQLVLGTEHLVNLPVSGSFDSFASNFTTPKFNYIFDKKVWIEAITIAIVASLETMLSIEAIDKLDTERRVTSGNRELFAQGTGNIISGLLGGLPITSVIVRSSANLNTGAKSKMSAILHGVLLLLSVYFIPTLINKIPLAALAAILIMTGYKLCKWSVFKEIFGLSKHQYIPFLVTVVAVVFTDLLIGVTIGLVVSIFWILRGNMKSPYYFHSNQHKDGQQILIELSQEVSFLNKASMRLTLDHLPQNAEVVIDASNTKYIDYDVLEIINEFKEYKAPVKNVKLTLKGFRAAYNITNNDNSIN